MHIQQLILSVQQTLDKPDAILRQSDKPPKLIFKLFQGLIEAFPDDTKHVKLKCEEDLVEAIDDDEWIQICLNNPSCTYNLRHKLLKFKTIHRTYYMPVKLNTMHSDM